MYILFGHIVTNLFVSLVLNCKKSLYILDKVDYIIIINSILQLKIEIHLNSMTFLTCDYIMIKFQTYYLNVGHLFFVCCLLLLKIKLILRILRVESASPLKFLFHLGRTCSIYICRYRYNSVL